YGDLTVRENLDFYATLFGTTVEENYPLIADIYSQIEPFEDRLAAHLSGGMKQKLAIACALAQDAQMLVLDEPTANLDPQSAGLVFDTIGQLRRQGRTLVIIEHRFDRLLPLVDRVVLFDRDGRMHRQGDPRSVVREEWQWLVEQGVVAPWKAPPFPTRVASGAGSAASAADADQSWTSAQRSAPVIAASGSGTSANERRLPVLELRDATVAFSGSPVWEHVNVSIAQGEFVAIVGPNGSGKSTLLTAMAGLTKLTEGNVQLGGAGVDRRAKARWRKAVGLCFQNPELQFLYNTVGDEAASRTLGDEDLPAPARALLNEFGLLQQAEASPFELSQGQKRRLSVAVMLQDEHDVYLFDEPTFGQDARTQEAIMRHLVLRNRLGKAIVMTTHDMDLVRRYAHRVIVLGQGRVLFDGPVDQLWGEHEVIARAHLVDDVQSLQPAVLASCDASSAHDEPKRSDIPRPTARERATRSPAGSLNPSLHLITAVLAIVVGIFATHIAQAAVLFAIPLLLMIGLAHMTPLQVLKRMSAFLVFYVFWVWSMTAFARVAPGSPVIHILWLHPSLSGLRDGVLLALRMLSAVGFGALFIMSSDITNLIVSLSQTLRISPRFAYGVLAGVRFAPLFRSEWAKLRHARELRGRDARLAFLRPVMYALPLLTQAIRMSERVAVAMEARGFRGEVATDRSLRTFYRVVPVRARDFAFMVGVVALCVGSIVWVR
ncbi:MAG: ATP-binding cassette domain-containing protein, partial [Firmicutes bacterium]|nr:ATP-binding cassette domain-containing protein [Bacillota bacterium]